MEYKRKRLIRAALQKAESKHKQTVRQAESAAGTEQQTSEEYAQTVVSEKTAHAAENLQNKVLDTGRISYRQFRILQEKRLRVPTTHVAQPVETENAPPAQSSDRREISKRQHFRKKALDKQAVKTPDSYRDKMQALKRQHLTREAVRRHLQKQAGGTVLGSGVRLPDTVPVFSGGGIRQAALGRVRTVLQAAWLRLKAMLARTIRRAAGALMALLGAGGVVLMLAMVIGAAAAVIGSPMGILFADESGDPNSIRLAEIVAETNADFGTAINDIVSAHPECSETMMEYDYEDGHTWASYWPEVLAVFAVQNNLNNDGDVVVIDEAKKQMIQDTFWSMHKITCEVEEVTAAPEPTEDEPDQKPFTEYSAHHGQQQIGGRAGRSVPLYARPTGHFAPAAFRGNAPQPACPVRRDCRCRWRVVLAITGAHLYILPLRGGGCLRQRRASRHGYSRAGGYANPSCPQRYGTGQWLERQLRQSGSAG